MNNYQPETYGDRIADVYDDLYSRTESADAVAFLAELAGGGPALELGIGTGRVALPLAARGVKVQGIDASGAMVARLRAKPGGDQIPVTMGEFSQVDVEGTFSLVYVVFSTFFALLTQDDQVRCFRGVARRLTTNGVFVIEAFVPDVSRFVRGGNIAIRGIETDQAQIDVSKHDPVTQQVTSQHVYLAEAGIKLYPVQIRYAWPSELDLMAQLAGLRLRERWANWRRETFTAASTGHISVYERAELGG